MTTKRSLYQIVNQQFDKAAAHGGGGDDFYSAPNPPHGAVLTYHLRDGLETLAEQRRKAEKETEEGGGAIGYPTSRGSWRAARSP